MFFAKNSTLELCQYAKLPPHPFHSGPDGTLDSIYRSSLPRQQVLLGQETFSGCVLNQLFNNVPYQCDIAFNVNHFHFWVILISFRFLCTCRWAKYNTSWGICVGPWAYCLTKLWGCFKHAEIWKIRKIIWGIFSQFELY